MRLRYSFIGIKSFSILMLSFRPYMCIVSLGHIDKTKFKFKTARIFFGVNWLSACSRDSLVSIAFLLLF